MYRGDPDAQRLSFGSIFIGAGGVAAARGGFGQFILGVDIRDAAVRSAALGHGGDPAGRNADDQLPGACPPTAPRPGSGGAGQRAFLRRAVPDQLCFGC